MAEGGSGTVSHAFVAGGPPGAASDRAATFGRAAGRPALGSVVPGPIVPGLAAEDLLPELLPGLMRADALDEPLAAVERELTGLREEVDRLRQRDQTLNVYMQRLDDELRLAARLQQDFLPKQLPRVGPVRFEALWRPAGYVSGDLYDVVRLDETHVGFYLADAVGHGVPAALLTMYLRHALPTKEITADAYRLLDPGEALGRLNDALLAQRLAIGTFCTACYGVLNTRTLELRLASAGHPDPLLFRGDDPAVTLRADGALLGVFEGERYVSATHQLRPGDRLLLFSDGIEVAFDEDRTAHRERWRAELLSRRRLGAEAFVADLAKCLDGEAGSLDPRDDLTLLVAEVE
jgi:sigma-B regulation protein RsbU (phosphoserine phosphatase)